MYTTWAHTGDNIPDRATIPLSNVYGDSCGWKTISQVRPRNYRSESEQAPTLRDAPPWFLQPNGRARSISGVICGVERGSRKLFKSQRLFIYIRRLHKAPDSIPLFLKIHGALQIMIFIAGESVPPRCIALFFSSPLFLSAARNEYELRDARRNIFQLRKNYNAPPR